MLVARAVVDRRANAAAANSTSAPASAAHVALVDGLRTLGIDGWHGRGRAACRVSPAPRDTRAGATLTRRLLRWHRKSLLATDHATAGIGASLTYASASRV